MDVHGWDLAGDRHSLALAIQHPQGPDRIGASISDDDGKFWRGKALGVGYNPSCALLPDRLLVTASRWMALPRSADGLPDVVDDKRLKGMGNTWGFAGTLFLWRLPRKLDAVPPPKAIVEHGILSSRMATDGKDRVFLVLVRPAPDDKSSLWLMMSKDGGATWDKPQQLTDGKSVDWEPSVIFYHGSVWIAYSHSEAGRLASTIRYIRMKIDPDRS
jgi:hypothetical protein